MTEVQRDNGQAVALTYEPTAADMAAALRASGDRHGIGLVILPERGVREGGDADRLRALLDRHTRRT
ncbi:hypothetical protein ABZ208_32760 [Streptomyces sp. NPDC006208]|uniref:hypothetical protein n=1 Tax=Streptomyces sp. NPDC006208 TaxID=3156734 RepID=UPI0033A8BC13